MNEMDGDSMYLTNEERRLLITAVQDLDANGRFGHRASLLLDKLQKCEQQVKNEQTSFREQILKLEKVLDKACEELESFCLTYESIGFQEPFTKEEWKEQLLNECR